MYPNAHYVSYPLNLAARGVGGLLPLAPPRLLAPSHREVEQWLASDDAMTVATGGHSPGTQSSWTVFDRHGYARTWLSFPYGAARTCEDGRALVAFAQRRQALGDPAFCDGLVDACIADCADLPLGSATFELSQYSPLTPGASGGPSYNDDATTTWKAFIAREFRWLLVVDIDGNLIDGVGLWSSAARPSIEQRNALDAFLARRCEWGDAAIHKLGDQLVACDDVPAAGCPGVKDAAERV
jgi:hypothetical protein